MLGAVVNKVVATGPANCGHPARCCRNQVQVAVKESVHGGGVTGFHYRGEVIEQGHQSGSPSVGISRSQHERVRDPQCPQKYQSRVCAGIYWLCSLCTLEGAGCLLGEFVPIGVCAHPDCDQFLLFLGIKCNEESPRAVEYYRVRVTVRG